VVHRVYLPGLNVTLVVVRRPQGKRNRSLEERYEETLQKLYSLSFINLSEQVKKNLTIRLTNHAVYLSKLLHQNKSLTPNEILIQTFKDNKGFLDKASEWVSDFWDGAKNVANKVWNGLVSVKGVKMKAILFLLSIWLKLLLFRHYFRMVWQ